MNRDLVVHNLVALDAQLRRMRSLVRTIKNPAELTARLPALLEESCRTSQRALSRVAVPEGWQATPAAPIEEGWPTRPR